MSAIRPRPLGVSPGPRLPSRPLLSSFLPTSGLLVVSLLFSLPGISWAGPNSNAKILLHIGPKVGKTVDACAPTLTNCFGNVTAAPVVTGGYFVYLMVADLDPVRGVAGVQCGIQYDVMPGRGIDVFDWKLCAAVQFQRGPWPESGAGDLIVWDLESTHPDVGCQRDPLAIAGYFYIATYGPDRMALTPLPTDGRAMIADCQAYPLETNLTNHLPSPLGYIDIGGGTGYNPCQGDVPLPDLAVPTLALSSNRITTADALEIRATIQNQGGAPAPPYEYQIKVDALDFGEGSLPSLSAGGTTTLVKTLTKIPAGFRFINLYLDPHDRYAEPDEVNNFTGTPVLVDVGVRAEPPVVPVRIKGGSGSVPLTLEVDAPYDAARIDPGSIRLAGSIGPIFGKDRLGDQDHDGIRDLTVYFSRDRLIAGATAGSTRPVVITGNTSEGFTLRGAATLAFMAGGGSASEGAAIAPSLFVRPVQNPLSAAGEIRYGTAVAGRVTLRLIDLSGRAVRTLVDRSIDPGEYAARFDGLSDSGARLASGVYFLALEGPEGRRVEKIVLRR